jgi:hypothetical protein
MLCSPAQKRNAPGVAVPGQVVGNRQQHGLGEWQFAERRQSFMGLRAAQQGKSLTPIMEQLCFAAQPLQRPIEPGSDLASICGMPLRAAN